MSLAIPSYPPDPAPGWCAQFIGMPYVERGRARDGCDCWGMCWIVLEEQFGLKPPRLDNVTWGKNSTPAERRAAAQLVIDASEDFFVPVESGDEQPGDIITLRIAGSPLHIGMVVAPGWMLHCAEDANSALERYDGMMWSKRVEGFFRLRHD